MAMRSLTFAALVFCLWMRAVPTDPARGPLRIRQARVHHVRKRPPGAHLLRPHRRGRRRGRAHYELPPADLLSRSRRRKTLGKTVSTRICRSDTSMRPGRLEGLRGVWRQRRSSAASAPAPSTRTQPARVKRRRATVGAGATPRAGVVSGRGHRKGRLGSTRTGDY